MLLCRCLPYVIHNANLPQQRSDWIGIVEYATPLVALLNITNKCAHRAFYYGDIPDSKVHGANMGPIWGRQDPGGPHVGPMNFAIWDDFRGI